MLPIQNMSPYLPENNLEGWLTGVFMQVKIYILIGELHVHTMKQDIAILGIFCAT